MNYKNILFLVGVILVFGGGMVSNVQATVGGPTFIYDFKYNPQDESVYYKTVSESGIDEIVIGIWRIKNGLFV